MLDWDKIDNEKLFQRLVNELFGHELNRPGYKPSSPYIGADGGWDGRFEDPYLGLTGTSSVQAKWTKHNLNDAYDAIREPVKAELEKSKSNGVRNLILATNADLRVGVDDHIGKLEKLNTHHVESFFVYPRAKLTELIEKHTWLRCKYFGQPQYPLLAPATDYAQESEPGIDLEESLLERSSELAALQKFVIDSSIKILIVHSPQGMGKSRFLIEAAMSLQSQVPTTWQSWFCRPRLRSVEQAFQDEIHKGLHYVIFLDNADLDGEFTRTLISAAKHLPASDFKLVLSCRTYNKDYVRDLVRKQRLEDYEMMELQQLSESTLIAILSRASQGRTIEHPERIVRDFAFNPALIIEYGRLIAGEVSPQKLFEEMRALVVSGSECLEAVGIDQKCSKILLREIAVSSPLRLEDHEALSIIARATGVTEEAVRHAIDSLIKARVLRSVGSSVRFISDLHGSIFLCSLLDESVDNSEASDILGRWFDWNPPVLAENFAAAGHFANTEHIHEAVQSFIRKTTAKVSESNIHEKKRTLAWIRFFGEVAPVEVIDLLYTFITTQREPGDIDRDEYGPVIAALLHIPRIQFQTLDLIKKIAERKMPGRYSNYQPENLVRSAVSPVDSRNFGVAINALEILSTWMTEGRFNEASGDLIAAAVHEALRGSHEYSDAYRGTMTFGRRALAYSAKMGEYRSIAMSMYKQLLNCNFPVVQAKALKLYSEIGQDSLTNEGPLWDRVLRDRFEALQSIDELLSTAALPFNVTAEAEETLMRLWAENESMPELSAIAESMLKKIDRSPEFLVFKFLAGAEYTFPDFEPIRSIAPKENRWHWLVNNHMRFSESRPDYLSPAVEALSKKYKTASQLLSVLKVLDSNIKETNWQYVPLIENWATFDKSIIIEIIQRSELFDKVPRQFQYGFHSVAADNLNEYVQSFAQRLASADSVEASEIGQLIGLATQTTAPCDQFLDWMLQLVPKLDVRGVRHVLDRAYWYFQKLPKAGKVRMSELLQIVLDLVGGEELLDSYDLLVHRIISEGMTDESTWPVVRTRLLEIMRNSSRLGNRGGHLLANLIGNDLEQLLTFIEYRLRLSHDSETYVDAIPFGGFEMLHDVVVTYEDFSVLVERITEWTKRELIYSHDIFEMLRTANREGEPGKESFVSKYTLEQSSQNTTVGFDRALVALQGMNLTAATAEIYRTILDRSVALGRLKETLNLLTSKALTGSYSGTLGEVPRELADKQAALSAIFENLAPGEARSAVKQLREQVDNTIKSELSRAAEILESR